MQVRASPERPRNPASVPASRPTSLVVASLASILCALAIVADSGGQSAAAAPIGGLPWSASVFPLADEGCSPDANQVSLFTDSDYGGQCVTKPVGDFSTPDFIGLPENDSISSLKVGANVKARLCTDAYSQGVCEDFTGDDADLSDNTVGNDTVSSVQVTARSCAPTADQVAFYMDENYAGPCTVRGVGDYSNSDAIGVPDNSVTAVKVGANVKVRLCSENNYEGNCEELIADDPTLADNAIGNDSVSSARVIAVRGADLRPYAPSGYSYPVVPSAMPGTTSLGNLYAGQTTYFDWHFANTGSATAAGTFHVELWLDGSRLVRSSFANYAVGAVGGADDFTQTVSTAGWHTVRLVVDADGTVSELDEGNNSWEKRFCWQTRSSATPGPTPTGHRVFLPIVRLDGGDRTCEGQS